MNILQYTQEFLKCQGVYFFEGKFPPFLKGDRGRLFSQSLSFSIGVLRTCGRRNPEKLIELRFVSPFTFPSFLVSVAPCLALSGLERSGNLTLKKKRADTRVRPFDYALKPAQSRAAPCGKSAVVTSSAPSSRRHGNHPPPGGTGKRRMRSLRHRRSLPGYLHGNDCPPEPQPRVPADHRQQA